ncbi:MAG: hypothetical protein PVJ57_04355 [Phycisphaerae bacterium]|jgi:hypothetical protein
MRSTNCGTKVRHAVPWVARVLKLGFAAAISAQLLLACMGCGSGLRDKDLTEYTVEFREMSKTLYLPLFIQTAHRSIYRNRLCGVFIESIEVNGQAVPPEPYLYLFELDGGELQPASAIHGYQLVVWADVDDAQYYLMVMSDIQEDDYTTERYCLGKDMETIRIRYRPRYPRNELGVPMTVEAKRNDH